MPTREKRVDRARRNPKAVGFEGLCRIQEDHGFSIRTGGKGSHYIAVLPGSRLRMTFPRGNPTKVVYVRRALELIEESEVQDDLDGE